MLKLEFSPTEAQHSEIKYWLKEEQDNSDEGFYCNWHFINRHFENENLIVGLYENLPIGFITYNHVKSNMIFDIMEIKPSHRSQGLGTKMMLEAIELFKEKGVTLFEVDCTNEGAERFCVKLGFFKNKDPYRHFRRGYLLLI